MYIYIYMCVCVCLCWRTFYRPAKRIDFDGMGWGGAITFIGTYTHTWCYATARSSATSTHTWCYATARSSATSAHRWCYATATFIKQLSWFDFGPLEDGKVKPSSSETPFFPVKIDVSLWRNDHLVINMRTAKIPPGCLCVYIYTN